MAKSVRKINREMNADLSRREASRLAQNERRKAQRRLSKILSEELGERVTWKEAYERAIGNEEISGRAKTYVDIIESLKGSQKGYTSDIKKVQERIKTETYYQFGSENLSTKASSTELFRRNEQFKDRINQATLKDGLSDLRSMDVHGFYAVTQYIWGGTSVSDNRNAKIMREFGLNDLEQVYKLITDKELKAKEFGFEDEELFEQWLDEIRKRVDLDAVRKAFDASRMISDTNDEPEIKYDKIKIANVRLKSAMIKRYAK